MYWSQEDFEKWTDHINGIVGENSEEGAFLVAEKTKGIEILMAGERQEVLELMASAVYNFSKNHGIAFEDVLVDI